MRPSDMKILRRGPGDLGEERKSSGGGSVRLFRSDGLVSAFRRVALLVVLCLGCGGGGSEIAATGGIGGTGISQGTITAFGSIFVNGIEWNIDSATIEVDGSAATETDLRVGMRVRVVGDFTGDGSTGSATSVRFDASIEGPISDVPVLVLPGGTEKSFTILGRTILVDQSGTVFGDGASFASLVKDQVLEISGYEEDANTIRASRVALRGLFPAVTAATLSGTVQNLTKNPDGSGIFEIGSITIRYSMMTQFEDLTVEELVVGRTVDVEGALCVTGNELDADQIEAEEVGLGQADIDDVELEGVVSNYVSLADFDVDGVNVDASSATLEPLALVVADGSFVEVEGALIANVIVADVVKSEEDEEEEVAIRAAVTSVDLGAQEITVLGIVVFADGHTEIQDERDGDENFMFSEIAPGDWLDIEGFEDAPGRVRAKQIVRKSVESDIVLKGPVTDLDSLNSTFFVLEQMVPLDNTVTAYFDAFGLQRTEEEFFRTPGDLSLGDRVVVTDENAVSPGALGPADTVELD